MELLTYIFTVLVGFIAGIVGGFLGICGCVVMFPVLILVFHYPIDMAVGTNVTAAVFTAASGALAHLKLRNVRLDVVLPVLVSGVVGATLGSLVFDFLRKVSWVLYILTSVMFAYVVARLILDVVGIVKQSAKSVNRVSLRVLIGLTAGLVTGLFGFGGGYVMVPSFMYLLGLAPSTAIGTSLTSYIAMLVVSSAFKFIEGSVNMLTAACLGIGTATGAQIGARLVKATPPRALKLIFAIILLYVAVNLLFKGLKLSP